MFKADELAKAASGRLLSWPGTAITGGICIDSRTLAPGDVFVAIKGDKFDGHDFVLQAIKRGAAAVIVHGPRSVVHSNKKVHFILVDDTTKALGDIARHQRRKSDMPVIMVTGSNGKTTTKEMIAHLLCARHSVLKSEGTKNNHIGLPLTLSKLKGSYDFAVLEAGTSHPGEIDYLSGICLPNAAVITNIGPSHLQYFKGLGEVYREKVSLFKHLASPRIGILNADCAFLGRRLSCGGSKDNVFSFGIEKRSDFFASQIGISNGRISFLLNGRHKVGLNTLGYHNVYNALAAAALARIFGIEYAQIARSLGSFEFPQGRLRCLKVGKASFIDDSYNSNPLSLRQALDTLGRVKAKGRKIFIMGDMLELGEGGRRFHLEAGRQAAGVCDCLVTVGRLSRLAAESAAVHGFKRSNIFNCGDSARARDILFKEISPAAGDVVLIKGSRSMKMEEIIKDRQQGTA